MSVYSDEVLWQLFLTGPVWDGDLASKTGRDQLVNAGYVVRTEGWQTLTDAGLRFALAKGLGPRKDAFASARKSPWPTNETLRDSGLVSLTAS